MKVAIIVGHTEKEPGAMMNHTPTCSEYDYNKAIAKNCEFLGGTYGIDIKVLYRDGIYLQGAYLKAQEWGAEIVLELHLNSVESPEPEGAEILCSNQHKSHKLPEIMLPKMVKLFGGVDRGTIIPGVEDRGYTNVNRSIPYFLIEPLFCSNPEQAKKALDSVVPYAILIMDSLKEFRDTINGNGLSC